MFFKNPILPKPKKYPIDKVQDFRININVNSYIFETENTNEFINLGRVAGISFTDEGILTIVSFIIEGVEKDIILRSLNDGDKSNIINNWILAQGR